MKKCALFYLAISKSNTVCFNEILNDFVNKIDQYRINRVPQYLASTLKKSDQFSMIEMVDSVKTFILYLFALSEVENLFLNELGKCSYKPELLFDDDDIIERLKQQPMALWKLKH